MGKLLQHFCFLLLAIAVLVFAIYPTLVKAQDNETSQELEQIRAIGAKPDFCSQENIQELAKQYDGFAFPGSTKYNIKRAALTSYTEKVRKYTITTLLIRKSAFLTADGIKIENIQDLLPQACSSTEINKIAQRIIDEHNSTNLAELNSSPEIPAVDPDAIAAIDKQLSEFCSASEGEIAYFSLTSDIPNVTRSQTDLINSVDLVTHCRIYDTADFFRKYCRIFLKLEPWLQAAGILIPTAAASILTSPAGGAAVGKVTGVGLISLAIAEHTLIYEIRQAQYEKLSSQLELGLTTKDKVDASAYSKSQAVLLVAIDIVAEIAGYTVGKALGIAIKSGQSGAAKNILSKINLSRIREMIDWIGNKSPKLAEDLRIFFKDFWEEHGFSLVPNKTMKALKASALIDELTGLPNFQAMKRFFNILAHQINRLGTNTKTYILMIDLDGFKQVNDSLGHDVGDEVLKEFSRILHKMRIGIDTVFRKGGDEFLIVSEHPTDGEAVKLAQRILNEIAASTEPFDNVATKRWSASIGIAEIPPIDKQTPVSTVSSLINEAKVQADKAMYYVKQKMGKNGFHAYDSTLEGEYIIPPSSSSR